MNSKHRKLLIGCAKFAISFAILGYLFHHASQDEGFSGLSDQPKNWLLLLAALALGRRGVAHALAAHGMGLSRCVWVLTCSEG